MISGLIENAKLIAETVTAISAAIIVLGQALKIHPETDAGVLHKNCGSFVR